MARHLFARTPEAVVQDAAGNFIPGRDDGGNVQISATAWTAETGGTQLTDLLTPGGSAIAGGILIPDENGRLPRFQGPDGRGDVWIDTGLGGRLLLNTTDVPARVSTLETTTTTNTASISSLGGRVTTLEAGGGGGGGTITGHPPATAIVYSGSFRAARPATDSANYTWTCDGTGDQTEINAAITAVNADGGGRVLLLGSTFSVTDTILLRTNVELDCGMAIITAATDFQDGIIGLVDTAAHRTSLVNFNLNGAGRQVHGINYIGGNAGDAGQIFTSAPATNPDPSHTIRNGNIYSIGNSTFAGHGMHMFGGNLRAGKYSDIRILGASGCGLWIDHSVDSHYTNIEIGSSGDDAPAYSVSDTAPVGHGFYISQGENNMFTACKSWYSRGAGFYVRANRCGFANCQAQDNYSYGFQGVFGKNSYVGCHADSNGQGLGTLSRGRDGFWLGSDNNLVSGCFSYDRGRGWQQYGFRFGGGLVYSSIRGCVTYTNILGSTTGTPGTGTATPDVQADSGGN